MELLVLIEIAVLWLIIMAFMAPLESLSWYAGWFGDPPDVIPRPEDFEPSTAEHFVVYLTGISGADPHNLLPPEPEFIERLRAALPEDTVVIDDIFPYSVNNQSLTGQRVFAWLWRRLYKIQMNTKHISPVAFLINIRNLFQVAVSADNRYAPIYNQSMASFICRHLLRYGYLPGSNVPITFIGYSGGGQISVGAAPFVSAEMKTRVSVISLGGVMSAAPGLDHIERMVHIYGTRDKVQDLGVYFFAGRWRVFASSSWNRARRSGRIQAIGMPGMTHTGKNSYMDPDAYYEKRHISYQERTVGIVAMLLRRIRAAH